MSLWRQRLAIDRAVANQLGPADEAKLRAHLAGCVECRRYYDAVSVQARILAGDPHTSAAGSERELARLIGALNPAAAPVVAEPSWWPRFSIAAGVAAALIFGVVSWRQSQIEPEDQITWRGGADAGSRFELWVVTAPQDGGELRRDIVFPSDPVGRVRINDWVAFATKGQPALDRVVLVSETGQTMVLAKGKSVALDAGTWRAFAVPLTPGSRDLTDEALSAAARAAGVGGKSLRLPGEQVSGLILVQP